MRIEWGSVITGDILLEAGACREGAKSFAGKYPDGLVLTEENLAKAHREGNDVLSFLELDAVDITYTGALSRTFTNGETRSVWIQDSTNPYNEDYVFSGVSRVETYQPTGFQATYIDCNAPASLSGMPFAIRWVYGELQSIVFRGNGEMSRPIEDGPYRVEICGGVRFSSWGSENNRLYRSHECAHDGERFWYESQWRPLPAEYKAQIEATVELANAFKSLKVGDPFPCTNRTQTKSS